RANTRLNCKNIDCSMFCFFVRQSSIAYKYVTFVCATAIICNQTGICNTVSLMYHYRKTRKAYAAFPKPVHCAFCDPVEMGAKAVQETKYAYVIPNRTFYDLWELREVRDHLLIIPKGHVGSLADISDAAKIDIINLIAQYERTDYNVYARAVTNKHRSIEHQHTHLIKTGNKAARFLLFMRKPYWLFKI
ncbi:MAG TPA: hypothetical protein VIJ25_15350, partial [Methylococcales bacterium]